MKLNAPFFEGLVKNLNNFVEKEPIVEISFLAGAKVSVRGNSRKEFLIEMWNMETGTLEYNVKLKSGFFAVSGKKYFVRWKIKIFLEGELLREEILDLKGKNVHVQFESSSLGDTLAWMPQAVKFSELHGCNLILTTFHNELFEKNYPQIQWNRPGEVLPGHSYSYRIGYFYSEDSANLTPIDPRTVPLGKVASDILGMEYVEISPELVRGTNAKIKHPKPYVCITTQSTAGAKLWQREDGWNLVVEYLRMKGFDVAVIQREPTNLKNVIDLTGDAPLQDRMDQIDGAEFFIGLGSGLSWLAWALKKKVILISGFSDPISEFTRNCERIINREVCNSCWNDVQEKFDKGDWNWCPRHQGPERQFECTKFINPIRVMESIERTISKILTNR